MKRNPALNVVALSLSFFLVTLHASDCLAVTTLQFFYPNEDASSNKITLTCNNSQKTPPAPTKCDFDAKNSLNVALSSWNEKSAVLKSTTNGIVIEGECRASVKPDGNFENSYQLEPVCRRNVGGVQFYFPDDKNNPYTLTCNGETFKTPPGNCPPDNLGNIVLSLSSWGGATTLFTRMAGSGDTFSGFCNKSPIPDKNQPGAYQLGTPCSPGRVVATGDKLVDEWFSDLPWHQKLSTVDSNLIDIPFILPHAAISKEFCPDNLNSKERARCMLRYGIVNVMAMHRTDTLYRPGETPDYPFLDCADGNCVEMKFEVQRINTQTNDDFAADLVSNKNYDLGFNNEGKKVSVPSLGFAITESTIFAPWRPWHTGHYCVVFADNISDSVCYENYFTTQLQAVSELVPKPGVPLSGQQTWLLNRAAVFWPQEYKNTQFDKWCEVEKSVCTMFLGKVKFRFDLTQPDIMGCQPEDCQDQLKQINKRTENLDEQFDYSLKQFADIGRFPWNEDKAIDPDTAILTNPFIGYYNLTFQSKDNLSGFYLFQAPHYALPKKCTVQDLSAARNTGAAAAIEHLKDCSTDFEIHTNGFFEQWKWLYGGKLDDNDTAVKEIYKVFPEFIANQYGRTMFMYAGLPEQKIPLSFLHPDGKTPIHDQIHGSSLYTQYLAMVNPDDQTEKTTQYTDNFWHAFFMSNHMNQEPGHFIRGIRGEPCGITNIAPICSIMRFLKAKTKIAHFKAN